MCIAIVALISGFLGIKIKDSIEYHNFTGSVSNLVSEMRRMQGFALSYRGEFGVKIAECKEGHFCYTLFSDEPVDAVTNFKPQVLKGVSEILKDKKSLKEFRFTILPTGKIEPASQLTLRYKDQLFVLDTRGPLQIKISDSYDHEW